MYSVTNSCDCGCKPGLLSWESNLEFFTGDTSLPIHFALPYKKKKPKPHPQKYPKNLSRVSGEFSKKPLLCVPKAQKAAKQQTDLQRGTKGEWLEELCWVTAPAGTLTAQSLITATEPAQLDFIFISVQPEQLVLSEPFMSVQAHRETCIAWWKCQEVCFGFGPHMADRASCSAQMGREQVQVTAEPAERNPESTEQCGHTLQYGSVMGGSGKRKAGSRILIH